MWEDVCNHTDCSRFYTFTFSDFLNTRFKKGFLWALMAVTIQSWFVKTNSSLTNLHIFKFNLISSSRLKPFGLFTADFNNKRISGVSADAASDGGSAQSSVSLLTGGSSHCLDCVSAAAARRMFEFHHQHFYIHLFLCRLKDKPCLFVSIVSLKSQEVKCGRSEDVI